MSQHSARLNQDLNAKKLWLTVDTDCSLVLDAYESECHYCDPQSPDCKKCKLDAYIRSLGLEPDGDSDRYCLWGRYAIEHARRVHQLIAEQILRFKDVSAVDVGFAVHEHETRFLNLLAIRIHVGNKHPVRYLDRMRIVNFTDRAHGIRADQYRAARKEKTRLPLGDWEFFIQGVKPWDVSFLGPADLSDSSDRLEGLKPARLPAEGRWQDCDAPDWTCCERSGRWRWCCPECCECWCRCCCTAKPAEPPECPGCSRPIDPSAGHCCKGDSDCCGCGHCCRCCETHGRLAICGVPLDIIEANYFPSVSHPGGDAPDGVFVGELASSDRLSDSELLFTGRGKVTPLVGGISVGTVGGQAGTIGAVVWDATDGSPCVLSNWHILAGNSSARAGQPCYQPALFDGGGEEDVIGHLKRWHLGELGDAAIAELDGSRSFASGEILGMWHPISGYKEPELNLEIRKWGRTTGFTRGFVDGIDLVTNIDYGNGFVRHFREQFHIAPLRAGEDVSQVGDSGSLVLAAYDLDSVDLILEGLFNLGKEALEEVLAQIGPEGIRTVEDLAWAIHGALRSSPPELDLPDHCILPVEEGLSDQQRLEEVLSDSRIPDAGSVVSKLARWVEGYLAENGIDLHDSLAKLEDRQARDSRNVYYAVGMIFAGDTPGTPFGEFALASDIGKLAKDLRFSLRPVFEPRSSFRELRSKPLGGGDVPRLPGGQRAPGALGGESNGQGPQPDGESAQSGPGSSGG